MTPLGAASRSVAAVARAVVDYLEGEAGDPAAGLFAGGGAAAYYGDLPEGPGRWVGAGAAFQRLTGSVDRMAITRAGCQLTLPGLRTIGHLDPALVDDVTGRLGDRLLAGLPDEPMQPVQRCGSAVTDVGRSDDVDLQLFGPDNDDRCPAVFSDRRGPSASRRSARPAAASMGIIEDRLVPAGLVRCPASGVRPRCARPRSRRAAPTA